MKYLVKGGRVIKMKASLSRMFQMKPVLTIKKGEIVQEGLVRGGSSSRLIDRLYDFANDSVTIQDLAIAHSVVPDQAEELKKRLGSIFPEEKIHMSQIGAAIGVHGGPGTIIVALNQGV